MSKLTKLDQWVLDILVDPISKMHKSKDEFPCKNQILDAKVDLKNSPGFDEWKIGQDYYESWANSNFKETNLENEINGINGVSSVYKKFPLTGKILDVGGGCGRLRHFLNENDNYISTDPMPNCFDVIADAEFKAYPVLNEKCNFLISNAEFQPFMSNSFDWVHMRSMLDHVLSPDLCMLEAHRVLKDDGSLLIGLYVEGGRDNIVTHIQKIKELVKHMLEFFGINKWKDYHTWHPSYKNLIKIIEDNFFAIEDVYWQPGYDNTVCYIKAKKNIKS